MSLVLETLTKKKIAFFKQISSGSMGFTSDCVLFSKQKILINDTLQHTTLFSQPQLGFSKDLLPATTIHEVLLLQNEIINIVRVVSRYYKRFNVDNLPSPSQSTQRDWTCCIMPAPNLLIVTLTPLP